MEANVGCTTKECFMQDPTSYIIILAIFIQDGYRLGLQNK